MKSPVLLFSLLLFITYLPAQDLQVYTIVENLNASGGVTMGPDGNIYVSDFAPSFTPPTEPTKAYKVTYGTWAASEFATGFDGASGSCFDREGNFYQSNPFGHKISKVSTDGTVEINWATDSLGLPVGIQQGSDGNFYVCDCSLGKIMRILPDGTVSTFVESDEFYCPNGLAIDPDGNLYACNYNDGKVFKITPDGTLSLLTQIPQLLGGPNPVGAGHLIWKNGFLFVTAIGRGQIFKVDMAGNKQLIAGVANAFSNGDGPALQATFSKPNGIAASITGDTLFVNVAQNSWVSNPNLLHPSHLRMITGVCSLPDVECNMVSNSKEVDVSENNLFTVSPNPSDGRIWIAFKKEIGVKNFKLALFDNYSRVVKTATIEQSTTFFLSTEGLPAGMYFLNVVGEAGSVTEKVIVK